MKHKKEKEKKREIKKERKIERKTDKYSYLKDIRERKK